MSNQEQVLPHNLDIEKKVLGCCMRDADAAFVARERIGSKSEKAFYQPSHGKIYDAIQHVLMQNGVMDFSILGDCLITRKELDKIGGVNYLADIAQGVATSANIEHYLEILLDKSHKRAVIRQCQELSKLAYGDVPREELEKASQAMALDVLGHQDNSDKGPQLMSEFQEDAISWLDRSLRQSENPLDGMAMGSIKTGFNNIDYAIGGIENDNLVLVLGEPGSGKTSLTLNIAENIARAGKNVLYVSKEMGKKRLARRGYLSAAGISMQDAKISKVFPSDCKKLLSVIEEWSKAGIDNRIWIDGEEVTGESFFLRAQQIHHKVGGLAAIFIDFLQIMDLDKSTQTDTQKLDEILDIIVRLKNKIQVPVFLLAQFSKQGSDNLFSTDNPEPEQVKKSIRGTGLASQVADIMFTIWEKKTQPGWSNDKVKEIGVRFAKNREGALPMTSLKFDKPHFRFHDLDPHCPPF